jgi:hypothetical protein
VDVGAVALLEVGEFVDQALFDLGFFGGHLLR